MDNQGWIKIFRSIEQSAVWADPLRLKAWIWSLLHANYEDAEWIRNGSIVTIHKGQCATSNRKLQLAWNCCSKTVTKILKQFEELNMIRVESPGKRYTLLTVEKYSLYQDVGNTKGHTKGYKEVNSKGDSEGDSEYPQVRRIKKDKEYKEEKKTAGAENPFGWVVE